jgi:membrane-bound lytic murein transglycosylase D
MQLPKSLFRWICCISIGAAILSGCSRHEVKRAATIPDTAAAQSTSVPKKKASRGSQYDTLWDRLFALYALPPIDHPDIDRELSWFANHPAYLERAQNRAEPFLYSIVKLVEKKNVPGEIALLPIVESAFQPNVVSSARAAGIWQFIPSTGTNYGLKRSHSYDGRRDVYASTKAAIKYLKKLHGDFGDWLLAIAAYNCGEGAVGRAIRRNEAAGLPTDFWSLNLPQETRAYVPKLLAVSRLFADAEKYGISLKDLPNMPQYKPVKVSNQLDLALAADAAGISLDKLYELNPGFRGQYADIDGSYHLYIPANKKAAEFRQEVERLSMSRRSFVRPDIEPEYVPVEPGAFQSFRREFARRPAYPGGRPTGGRFIPMSMTSEVETPQESLNETPPPRIAKRRPEPVSPPEPRDVEPRREPAPRRVKALEAEPLKPRAPVTVATAASQKPAETPSKKSSYAVLKGETLYAVARKHSVNVAQLAKWNNIPITTEVQTGQKLIVAETAPNNKPTAPSTPSSKAAKAPVKPASESRSRTVTADGKRKSATSSEPRKVATASSR